MALVVALAALVFLAYAGSKGPFPSIHVYPQEKTFTDPKTGSKVVFPSLFDSPSVDLSVVIPAYNEEDRLPVMLEESIDYLSKRFGDRYEVILVDDGSKDKTTSVGLEWSKKLGSEQFRVLTLEKNLGKGGAVRRGVLVARGKLILFADADGATTFSELDKLLAAITENGIVCGSRAHMEEESIAQRSSFRTVLMYGFHWCVWMFGSRTIKDTQCGFKLLTRDAARQTFPSLHIERWAFDVELLKIAEMTGIPLKEVPVQWTEIEGSKLNPVLASIQMFKDLFLLWLRYMLGFWKLAPKKLD